MFENLLKKERLLRGLQLYLSSAILYGLGILLFRYLSYYQRTIGVKAQETLLYLYLGYLILAPILYFLFICDYSENKPYLFFRAVLRNLLQLAHKREERSFRWEMEEKVAVLFILVKLFFLPTMTDFFFDNYGSLSSQWNSSSPLQWYPFLLTFMFGLDTLIFSIGYAFESRKLGNTVKSVEPTFFGWFVALICYPPLNSIVGGFIPWGANDYAAFWSPALTIFFRIILVGLLLIYVWASVALGLKSSNLTNRGIVGKFPYSIVRHPAYVSKNLIWWLTLLPVINFTFALGLLFWTFIYICRAITEEKHLGKDPDYQEYSQKVKYRFIPGVV